MLIITLYCSLFIKCLTTKLPSCCPTVLQITVLPCLFYFPVILSHCHFAVLSMLLFSWVFSIILWVWEKTFRSFTFQKIISLLNRNIFLAAFLSACHIFSINSLSTLAGFAKQYLYQGHKLPAWCKTAFVCGCACACAMYACMCWWVHVHKINWDNYTEFKKICIFF